MRTNFILTSCLYKTWSNYDLQINGVRLASAGVQMVKRAFWAQLETVLATLNRTLLTPKEPKSTTAYRPPIITNNTDVSSNPPKPTNPQIYIFKTQTQNKIHKSCKNQYHLHPTNQQKPFLEQILALLISQKILNPKKSNGNW